MIIMMSACCYGTNSYYREHMLLLLLMMLPIHVLIAISRRPIVHTDDDGELMNGLHYSSVIIRTMNDDDGCLSTSS